MPRVVGVDPGTVSLDLCGLEDGRLILDATWPTAEALAEPRRLLERLVAAGPLDLVLGPSGYGLPLRRAAEATEEELRLAFLAAPEDPGGIGGLRNLVRILGSSGLPVVLGPGVIHLDTVPRHRKLNRVDLGTADKLCAAALAIQDQAVRRDRQVDQVSLILLEMGGAFTAGVSVQAGRVVDGLGGTAGPIGWQAPGAWDGEVAFLAGEVTKAALFRGGVTSVLERGPADQEQALQAYVEGAIKAVHQLRVSTPEADEILISGRMAADPAIRARLEEGVAGIGPVRLLHGFAQVAKQGAQGAALIADGLAGGAHQALVERLRIREAMGTVLDHLYVIDPDHARRRLGLA
ncbi:MAG TPA: DUF1464 family protein [Gemmatimonadales bacterium]|jgi:predicted butyrate kinase (DUF1464 family)|nr:DUF1464 family protein [Gemmatimonadales bacterium]